MPRPGSFESGKSRNEKQDEKKRGEKEVVEQNDTSVQKLAKATQKKPEEKKEKNWKIGFGSTKTRDLENPLTSVSATGVKIANEKSNFEATAGVGTIQEQKVPGDIPDNNAGVTIALNWKF